MNRDRTPCRHTPRTGKRSAANDDSAGPEVREPDSGLGGGEPAGQATVPTLALGLGRPAIDGLSQVTLRELPQDQRPRERLLANGAGSLSDGELIAILLRTGCRGSTALDLARNILDAAGGVAGLNEIDRRALRGRGLGPAKEATVLAAVELATRMARAELPERHSLHRPAAAARYLALRHGRVDQEIMGALYLDSRHRLMHEQELFRGTINRAAVEPRAVLKEGLLLGAAGFILFHTHPSGDPGPSAEDVAFTRRLEEAGEIVGLAMVDHLIVGRSGRWVSLRERTTS